MERQGRLRFFFRPEAGLLLLQVLFLAATRLWQRPILTDDAYIHFRNALNWSDGKGLLFNSGEWVLGTTSPIYALVLAMLHRITGIELPPLAMGFNFLADVGILLFCLVWFRRAGVPLLFRHAALLILAAEPQRMIYSSTGMELSFFVLVIFAIIESFHRGRWLAGGLLLGCLGWIRPEAVVVWVALAGALAIEKRYRELARGYGCAIAVALAFCLALLATYGSFVPHSLHAKAVASWFRAAAGQCDVEFFMNLGNLMPLYPLNGFQASWGTLADKINSSIVALAQIGVMMVGAAYLYQRRLKLFAMTWTFFALGYYVFYALTSPPIMYWYAIPYYFASLFLAALGWWALLKLALERAENQWGRRQSRIALAYPVITVCFLVLSLVTASRRSLAFEFRGESATSALAFRFRDPEPGSREVQYRRAAETLNAWIDGDETQTVGCTEIGIFGYYFEGRILDAFGLVSPQALEVMRPEVEAALDEAFRPFPLNVFMRSRPEYILTASMFLPAMPEEFFSVYEEIHRADIALRIFVRKDIFETLGDASLHVARQES